MCTLLRRRLRSRRAAAPPTRAGRAASRPRRRRRAGSSAGAARSRRTPPSVERLGDGVVGAHLEEHVVHAAIGCLGEQRLAAVARPRPRPRDARGDRDGLDVGIPRSVQRAQSARSRRCRPASSSTTYRPCGEASSSRIIASDHASVGNEARSSAMIASRSAGVAGARVMRSRGDALRPGGERSRRASAGRAVRRRREHPTRGERPGRRERDHRRRHGEGVAALGAELGEHARRASSRGTSAGSVARTGRPSSSIPS